jgi:hypothetical protein
MCLSMCQGLQCLLMNLFCKSNLEKQIIVKGDTGKSGTEVAAV